MPTLASCRFSQELEHIRTPSGDAHTAAWASKAKRFSSVQNPTHTKPGCKLRLPGEKKDQSSLGISVTCKTLLSLLAEEGQRSSAKTQVRKGPVLVQAKNFHQTMLLFQEGEDSLSQQSQTGIAAQQTHFCREKTSSVFNLQVLHPSWNRDFQCCRQVLPSVSKAKIKRFSVEIPAPKDSPHTPDEAFSSPSLQGPVSSTFPVQFPAFALALHSFLQLLL